MESLSPVELCQLAVPAPALSRGLAVLAQLGERAPLSLEQLATGLSLPKASVFRLLDTLEKIGAVRRTSDKRYEPIWEIRHLEGAQPRLRSRIEAKMPDLCAASACTVEWYEPNPEGMRLVLQKLPDCELRVQAKPGFVRDWATELDVVARLGFAFAQEAPAVAAIGEFHANGELRQLTAKQARQRVYAAATERADYDAYYNQNGVRRFAVAVLDENDQNLLGVLALAECYHFFERPDAATYLEQLKSTVNP